MGKMDRSNDNNKTHDTVGALRNFQWKVALTYHQKCPSLSRQFMSNFLKNSKTKKILQAKVSRSMCHTCGSIWMPGNHTIHIKRKAKIPKNIGKLIRMKAERSWKFSRIQKRILDSIQNRSSIMIYKCLCCKHKRRFLLPSYNKIKFKLKPNKTPQQNKQINKGNMMKKPKITKPEHQMQKSGLSKSSSKTMPTTNSRKRKKKSCGQLKALLKANEVKGNPLQHRLKTFLSSL